MCPYSVRAVRRVLSAVPLSVCRHVPALAISLGYTPSDSIVIPCFNEEEWISRPIYGCLNQHYPEELLK